MFNLYEWRMSLGLSSKEMASYMGVKFNTYSQWERDVRKVNAATQRLIALLKQIQVMCPSMHDSLIAQAKNDD